MIRTQALMPEKMIEADDPYNLLKEMPKDKPEDSRQTSRKTSRKASRKTVGR